MPERLTLSGVPDSAAPWVLSRLLENEQTILHVAVNDRAADALAAALPFFTAGVELVRFPAWDCLPYDRVSPRPALVSERVRALAALASGKAHHKRIVLTTVSALLQRVPPKSHLATASLMVKPGKIISHAQLLAFMATNGYRRVGKAVESGEYALRGGIVDIVPPGETTGLRLDFFGEQVESIRSFDPLTQISSGTVESASLYPAGEVVVSDASIERFRTAYRNQFGAVSREDPLYEAISSGQHYPGMEHWLPLFYEQMDTLLDYVPDALITFGAQTEATIEERHETIKDYYEARRTALAAKSESVPYNPLPPESLYIMEAAFDVLLEQRNSAWLSPFHEGRELFASKPTPNLAALRASGEQTPFEQLKDFAEGQRADKRATVLACLSNGSRERLAELLAENGAHVVRVDAWHDAERISGKALGVAALPIANGFITDRVALVSEQDLLGERIIRATPKKKRSEVFLAEAANFMEGELVVHREHGIGRFDGLVTIEVLGARHDCLKLTYADDDRLFLPVENIELLSRFGAEEEGVTLDKLGAASWQARKSRMKERIKIAAEALMKTAAERARKTAPTIEDTGDAYEAFSARFGFMETEDQARSIEEVLEDLRTGRPMDRLVCGDVGFGKTEVALRAAFAATHAIPKVQVALVVPTTLLARQHYKNFRKRFEGLNIKVAQLSRLVTAKEQKAVHEGLADGSIDIVVGTHALLAKSITFANLGLVIVDEEQHFGVGQKEKLKELKADVHVLTLSATPIPRTLQMALSGIRSLSLITTPPVDRLAVRTFVMPWDGMVLREAVQRELHRGGRVFVVTPRIKDIADLKHKLADLAPEAKVGVAHGQLAPSDLDAIMNDFYDGKYDVLLSTAIIESGLDIPQANTLIVHRADRFGLAQLYQLRGRVGRGKLRAYAYFLLPSGKELTKNATRRLEVMQSLDELGAGFQLASHDMDIRGFGNLVGEEQSGHIREVGVELYQQMLEEAVRGLKESNELVGNEDWSPQINLGLTVLIPETYVEDLQLRMGLYRRAGTLATPEEIDAFAAELIDRFGPLPDEVRHLLDVVRLKQMCKRGGIARIDAGPKGAVFSFHQDRFAKPEALLNYITKHPTRLKLRPDQKVVYMQEWHAEDQPIKEIGVQVANIGKLT